jgi:signal transduction histidine kinase
VLFRSQHALGLSAQHAGSNAMNARQSRWAAALLLLLAWSCLAAWQRREFVHERDLARDALRRQAAGVRQVLAAALRSHRRMGRLFDEQLQGVLDELESAPDVLAVEIADDRGEYKLSTGRVDLLSPMRDAEVWLPGGLQTGAQIDVDVEPAGRGGRGPAWRRTAEPVSTTRRFAVTLLMDRTATEAAVARAARLRLVLAAGGAVVIGSLALGAAAFVRAIRASARAESLRAETQRLRELSQAAAGLAHETRNPLGVVRGGLQRLTEEQRDGADNHRQYKLLIEECDRVTTRINQFLAYARPPAPTLRSVDLAPLTIELQALLQPDLEHRGVRLQCRVPAAHRWVRADPELLRQILFNLLQNAIAFSPQGETIDLDLAASPAGELHIAVADRGPGVDPADRSSLFTPYFTQRAGGAGLGLAIVNRLAQAQGWRVSYVDRPGGGALFRIEGIRGERAP